MKDIKSPVFNNFPCLCHWAFKDSGGGDDDDRSEEDDHDDVNDEKTDNISWVLIVINT